MEIVQAVLKSGEGVNFYDEDLFQHKPTRASNKQQPSTPSDVMYSALCLPVYDRENKVIAVVLTINKQGSGGCQFSREDERTMGTLCTQVSESMDNLYRRPEEHNTFEENLQSFRYHTDLPIRRLIGPGSFSVL